MAAVIGPLVTGPLPVPCLNQVPVKTCIIPGMQKQLWMVRAGRDSLFLDDFLSRHMIAVGWSDLGDLSKVKSREQINLLMEQKYRDWNRRQIAASVGQVYRFRAEIVPGTTVVTYDSNLRTYHIGTVTGDYAYHSKGEHELAHTRAVRWEREVSRDVLTPAAKNSLGSISTIFCLSTGAAEELLAGDRKRESPPVDDTDADDVEAESDIRKDTEQRALEFLQDKLSGLDWDQMQELVAGLLRAMGYKTRVSRAGPDQGRDIVASPDGFGFQPPHIIVEVKHRKATMGAPDIRSFAATLRQNDKGLYVSTGGFTKEATYEAKRTNQTLTLMDAEELGNAIVEHYDRMDADARALLPLKKIYWPV
jgi:restriction system protein